MQSSLGRLAMQFARDARRSRGVIDEDRALLHARESAVRSQRHGAHVFVIAYAGEDEVASLSRLAGRRGARASVLRGPAFGLGRRTIVDGRPMTFGLEMPGHRITHHAESEKSDLSQRQSSFAAPRRNLL